MKAFSESPINPGVPFRFTKDLAKELSGNVLINKRVTSSFNIVLAALSFTLASIVSIILATKLVGGAVLKLVSNSLVVVLLTEFSTTSGDPFNSAARFSAVWRVLTVTTTVGGLFVPRIADSFKSYITL